jgi:hypothetical protein
VRVAPALRVCAYSRQRVAMRRRRLRQLACCLAIAIPIFAGSPVFAVDDLRYELAFLREGLDAGITREEFHKLRIEIGAHIRILSDDQRQVMQPFLDKLIAADAIWMGIQTEYACKLDSSGFIGDGNGCRVILSRFYKVLDLDVPSSELSGGRMFPSNFVRPVLPEIAKATDLAIGLVK